MTASTAISDRNVSRRPRRATPAPVAPSRASDVRPISLVITDDDLRRNVLSRLSQFGPQVSRAVVAGVRSGDVMLIGDVDSDYERQLIEHSIARLAGVGSLDNRLRVRSGVAAPQQAGLALVSTPSTRHAAMAAGAAGVVALGWSLWQIAAACTG